MVLGVEDERDCVTGEGAVTDLDLEVCRRDGRGKGGEDKGSDGEMHFDNVLECFV